MTLSRYHRLLIGIAILAVGLILNVAVRSCTPEDLPFDLHPTEVALGVVIGAWLKDKGATDVVILDTSWEVPHLSRLADARRQGLERGLGAIPHRYVMASGPGGRATAWQEALDQCSPATVLVSCFGMPGKAPYPAVGAGLVLVVEPDGGGMPRAPRPLPCRIIRPRDQLLAPVGDPAWKGTDQERFDAYFHISDLPISPKKSP